MATKSKRRKSKDEAPAESASTRSGGVNLDADQVNVAGDITGRDKIAAGGDVVGRDKHIETRTYIEHATFTLPAGERALSTVDTKRASNEVFVYLAIVLTLLSALTFVLGSRPLSYLLAAAACAVLDVWLWRIAMTKEGIGWKYSLVQRRAIQAAAGMATLTVALWISINLRADWNLTVDPSDMVFVDAGPFIMGSDLESAGPDVRPARRIELNAYWIDVHEVTNAQYRSFVQAGYPEPNYWKEQGYPQGKDTYPVVHVSWHDAGEYCRSVGKQLPTEAEWEKAARGGDARLWPWGNDWDPGKANTAENKSNRAQPVGSYPEGISPYGVADMAGNVWEWVHDWYDAEYYSSGPATNPMGPGIGQTKVMRGGDWASASTLAYTFTRLGVFPPSYDSEVVGFRCACTNCRTK